MDNTKEVTQEEVNKELEESIDPDQIIVDNAPVDNTDDDSDMPEPETKNYDTRKFIACTDRFMTLFNEVVGELPFSTILKRQVNEKTEQIKLINLVNYVEQHKNKIELDEMNKILSFLGTISFKYARPLMEVIDDPAQHKTLFKVIQ